MFPLIIVKDKINLITIYLLSSQSTKAPKGNKSPDEGLKLALSEKPLSLEFPPI